LNPCRLTGHSSVNLLFSSPINLFTFLAVIVSINILQFPLCFVLVLQVIPLTVFPGLSSSQPPMIPSRSQFSIVMLKNKHILWNISITLVELLNDTHDDKVSHLTAWLGAPCPVVGFFSEVPGRATCAMALSSMRISAIPSSSTSTSSMYTCSVRALVFRVHDACITRQRVDW